MRVLSYHVLLLLTRFVSSFLIQGQWRLMGSPSRSLIIYIDPESVRTQMEDGASIVSKIKWRLEGNKIAVDASNFEVEKYPKLQSIAKYSKYIQVFRDAQRHGVIAIVDIIATDKIIVTGAITGKPAIEPFTLERI